MENIFFHDTGFIFASVDVEIEDAEQLDDSDPDELDTKLSSVFNDEPAVQFGNAGSEGM